MANKLGLWGVYSLLLNSIIGAGIMALPRVFQQAGVLVSLVCLVFIAALGWFLQSELLGLIEKLNLQANRDLEKPLLAPAKAQLQWDLPEIVRNLLGNRHWLFYFLIYYLAISSTLTIYANIVGTAAGTLIGHCDYALETEEYCVGAYRWGVISYLLLVGSLTVLDYKEQAWLQYIMTLLRYVLITYIVLFGLFRGSTDSITAEIAVFSDFPRLGNVLSTLIFGSMYQMCTPTILPSTDLSLRSHRLVALLICVSIIVLFGTMGSVGLVVPSVPDNISLLFGSETYGYEAGTVPYILKIGSALVILIPVLNICTNSPMYGQVLSGMITSSLYGTNHEEVRTLQPFLFRSIRFLVVFPPALLALLSLRLVRTTQGPYVIFAGNLNVVMLWVYIPICVNVARGKETGLSREVVNYGLAGSGSVLFVWLSYQQLTQSLL